MTITLNKCSLIWILFSSIAYLNIAVGLTDVGSNELCPCLPQDICPRTFGMKPEDEFYLGTILKCAEENHVRCCGVSLENIVGATSTLSSGSDINAEPEATTTDSVNMVQFNQETMKFSSDKQDEQSIDIHPTELGTLETTTVQADDENTIAYVYGARNEDALRELAFDDVTTDGSIEENQSVPETTQLPVAQDENTESMMTENGHEIATLQAVEISTEEIQQSTTVDSMNEAVLSTSTTERSFVQRTKDRFNNPVRRRYTNYRHRNAAKSQTVEVQAPNESLVIIKPSPVVTSTTEQPEKVEEAKLTIDDRESEVVTQTLEETDTERSATSVHPAIRNHGMMIMEVRGLLSHFMKNAITASSHQELIPLTKEEHTRQLNELSQNGASPVIQTNKRVHGKPVNRFQIQTSSDDNQENENVTQSVFVTTRRPKYQRRTLPARNSLQTTQSITTTISTPVTSIPLELSSSTVRHLKRKQYLQRRNPNGISTTLRTNSNENLVTVTESMPMTEDEKKQLLANKRKMLFAARRSLPVRNATITTTPNTLEADKTTEKVIPVTKVRASSPKRSKRPMRRYNPNNMRVDSSTEQEINAAINEE